MFGGPDDDVFKVGQMYNSERTEAYGVNLPEDKVEWTLTTKGFLSNGNTNPLSISGGFGVRSVGASSCEAIVGLCADANEPLLRPSLLPLSLLPPIERHI